MSTRREFARQLFGAIPVAVVAARSQQGSVAPAQKPAADTLAIPVERNANAMGPLDNDPRVVALERRLHCTCGCTLDVYTCRTTDFSCTVSPAMHADVVAQVTAGATDDQIIAAFVAKDGEKVLMAPAATGFNLMGYLVPGLSVTAVGLILAAWLMSKRTPVAASANGATPLRPTPDADQLERLRRALEDVES